MFLGWTSFSTASSANENVDQFPGGAPAYWAYIANQGRVSVAETQPVAVNAAVRESMMPTTSFIPDDSIPAEHYGPVIKDQPKETVKDTRSGGFIVATIALLSFLQ